MKTNLAENKVTGRALARTMIVPSLALAASLISFDAVAQSGVWVAHGSSLYWTCIASSASGSNLVATAQSANSLYTSTDSGTTWTLRNSSHNWSPVASSADGTKLVAGANSLLWLSTDSGLNWNNPPGGGPNQGWTAVASSSDGTKLAALGGLIYTSADSGATWTPHAWGGSSHSPLSIASSSDGTKLVATTYGDYIYTSADSGVTWIPRGAVHYWGGVACSADGTKLVALDGGGGGGGYIYTSTDSGTNWTQRGISASWSRVASSADGTRLVATCGGTSGQVYISTDSGSNWSPSGSAANWLPVASSADGYALVAGVYGGQIYTYLVAVANDQCSGAIALSSGVTYTMDTTRATSTSDLTPTCQGNFGKGVWFKYTPTGTGPVLVSTCGSSFDTVLQVYSGSCGALAAVNCNDDNGPACSGNRASLSFSGTAGTTYYILAGGYSNNSGTLQIAAQLLNDQSSGAIALANGTPYAMNTSDATSTGDLVPVCGYNVGKTVWFTFTPASSRVVAVNTCGSDFDTVVQPYVNNAGSLTPVGGGCNDDSNVCPGSRQSCSAFPAIAGTTYYLMVGGYNGASGNLNITASDVPAAITQQPVGGTVYAGDAFIFRVSATGTALSYQWQFSGANWNGATDASFTITDLDPTLTGDYRVVITNIFGAVTSSVATLTVDPALAMALDTTGLTWTTGGANGAWYRETQFSHDGVDAARCNGSVSSPPWLQTTVAGPGTLSFYWAFVIDLFGSTSDYLGLQVDGGEVAKRNASHFLQYNYQTIYLASGTHTLRWVYDRNGGSTGGAHLDQVSYISGATAALIATQPGSQTVVAGTNVILSVQAGGTPPLRYQWRFYGTNLADATDSALTLTNVMPVQAGNYSVVVTNDYGPSVTSSVVALTVTTVPLAKALEYSNPDWTTSGNASWFGQVGQTHDGVDAARSGAITNYQQSVLSLNLLGPGTLSFWWKVSSETNWDFLKVYTNNVMARSISGEVDWQQQTVSLPAGMHTVVWQYIKDISISLGQDAAWLDQVSYDGPPYLAVSPLTAQQVMLFWPTSATGFGLQSATNLAHPSFWQAVTNVPSVLEDNWVVTNNAALRQFYRLRK
jgi:hypothetical protein